MDDLKRIKEKISYQDVYNILDEFEAEPRDYGDHIESLTVCHDGDSHKLFYYKDTATFVCYTHDGAFDIFSFVQKVKKTDFPSAINWIKNRFGYLTPVFGEFISNNIQIEKENLNPLQAIDKKNIDYQKLRVYNENVLQDFYNIPHKLWLDEGISSETMEKYQISYNLDRNQIIIPHRNIDGELVGIRARNLDKYALDRGLKYSPIYHKKVEYKYPTGMNLYGIDKNKETINSSKQIILFEAEKSVMKMDSIYGCANAVALNGTMLSDYQVGLINKLDVNEVIIAVDKDFDDYKSKEAIKYAKKIYSIFKKLKNRYTVSIIWDKNNLLNEKDSPIDRGKEAFEQLLNERIYI